MAAAALNVVGSEVVAASRGTLEQKSEATAKFARCFEELLTTGLTLAGASKVGVCVCMGVEGMWRGCVGGRGEGRGI